MHITHVGPGERDAGVGGGKRHLFTRLQVAAIAVSGAQILEDQAHGRQRHAVGLGCGPVAQESLDRMGQGVDAGCRSDVRWQAGHQRGVQRRHLGHQAGVDDDDLALALGVGNHRGHRHLRAGAGGGGYGINRRRAAQALEVARQCAQRFAGVGDGCGDCLGRINGRAAAHGHDGVAIMRAVKINAAFDQWNRRIGRDLVKHHIAGAARGQRVGQLGEQAQLDDDAVGHDQDLVVPKTGHSLSQASTRARPHQQRGLGNWQETRNHAGALHQYTQAGCTGGFRQVIEIQFKRSQYNSSRIVATEPPMTTPSREYPMQP